MSIGDSNVVDGADVNSPSADAGPDPCVSNHDVLPVVPVVPDVPVSTEAMIPCTARRGIMEIPDRPTLRSQQLVVDPLNQCTASNRWRTRGQIWHFTRFYSPTHRSPRRSYSPAYWSPRRSRSRDRRGERVRGRRGGRCAGERDWRGGRCAGALYSLSRKSQIDPLCGLNHWSWIRSINVLPAIDGEHEAKYGISPVFIHQHTGHHAAHIHQHTGHHAGHVHQHTDHHAGHHVHHAGHVHVTGVVTGVLVNVTGVVTGVNIPDNH